MFSRPTICLCEPRADCPHEGCEYKEEIDMAFTLPPLPYDYAALEPHIDTQTMQIHHDKHHAAYVNNLNTALESHAGLASQSIEDILRNIGDVAEAISKAFGSFADLKAKINDAGVKRFGSGWSWLVLDKNGALQVLSTANQDSPLMQGQTPLLGVDVWEHAYYLKYQNLRPKYLEAWWNTVNWAEVAKRFGK